MSPRDLWMVLLGWAASAAVTWFVLRRRVGRTVRLPVTDADVERFERLRQPCHAYVWGAVERYRERPSLAAQREMLRAILETARLPDEVGR